MYFVHSYEFIPKDKSVISAITTIHQKLSVLSLKEIFLAHNFTQKKSDQIGLKIIDKFFKL